MKLEDSSHLIHRVFGESIDHVGMHKVVVMKARRENLPGHDHNRMGNDLEDIGLPL